MKWKYTQEGRMAIYYMSSRIIDCMKYETFIYNDDATNEDADKIMTFLRTLIITEWVGD